MSELSAEMDVAIAADRALVFGAIEINFPGYDLRLLDGAGEVPLFSSVFVGRDATYGTIGSIEPLKDGVGDQAPVVKLTLLPPSDTATATLAAATMQGSRVRMWVGVLNPATGLPVPDPYLVFDGEIDVPTLKWSQGGREIEYRIVSVFERFFELEEGIRLSDSWQQDHWPGELGLAFVTGVAEQVPWGTEIAGATGAVTGSASANRKVFDRSA